MNINWKSKFRDKTFILSMVGAIVLLVQQLGFKDLIPSNYADVVNSLLTILTMLGIVNDTKVASNSDAETVIQAVSNAINTKLDDKTVTENQVSTQTVDKNAIVLNSTIIPKENTAD